MTTDDSIHLICETFLLHRTVENLPNLRWRRDLLIQISKLHRLLMETPSNLDAFHALGGGSIKKSQKRFGRYAQEIGQQSRRVKELMDKFFKECLRASEPEMTNAKYRDWKKKFDAGLEERTQGMVRQVNDRVAERLANPKRTGFARLGGPRS